MNNTSHTFLSGLSKGYLSLLVITLFLFIGVGIYFISLDNPFQYDDHITVTGNYNIRKLENIPLFFFDPGTLTSESHIKGHYRPFIVTSYAVNYALGGLNPVGYHIVNLAFHIGSAFLIFLIVKAMLGNSKQLAVSSKQSEDNTAYSSLFTADYMAGVAAGLIFLVHPFNSEAVNYVTALSSITSGFFYLLGFYCWVKYRGQLAVSSKKLAVTAHSSHQSANRSLLTAYYIVSLLAFIAGMLSKEVVITLPVMFWLYDIYFLKDPDSSKKFTFIPRFAFRVSHYITYLPFLLVVIVPYFLIRLFTMNKVLDKFQRDTATQLLTEVPVLIKHWQMFIFPKGFSLVHVIDIYKGITWSLVFSIILLVAYVSIAGYLFTLRDRALRLISFFMFWFFIVLLPTTVIPLNYIFQENRGYLAVVSFAVVLGVLLNWLYYRLPRVLVAGSFTILVIMYIVITIQRNVIWGDSILFWKDAVSKYPDAGIAYAQLGVVYEQRGDTFIALETFKKGLTVAPNNFFLRVNLGMINQAFDKTDDAIGEYKKALELIPDRGDIWNRLATLYLKKGDLKRTEICIREGMKEWDDYPPLYYNMGRLLVKKNDLINAVSFFKQAILMSPSYLQVRYELAELLEASGRFNEADEQYAEILRLNSINADRIYDGTSEEDGIQASLIVEKAQQRLNSRKIRG